MFSWDHVYLELTVLKLPIEFTLFLLFPLLFLLFISAFNSWYCFGMSFAGHCCCSEVWCNQGTIWQHGKLNPQSPFFSFQSLMSLLHNLCAPVFYRFSQQLWKSAFELAFSFFFFSRPEDTGRTSTDNKGII